MFQNKEETLEYLTEVANALGKDWKVEFDNYNFHLISGDAKLSFSNRNKRLEIHASFPPLPRLSHYYKGYEKITVSFNKPPVFVARAIQKRLLPYYLPELFRWIQTGKINEENFLKRQNLIKEYAKILNYEPTKFEIDNNEISTFIGSGFYCKCSVREPITVKLEATLPAEIAPTILSEIYKMIKEHIAKNPKKTKSSET